MSTARPGWLLSLFAAGLSVSSWLPWLTTTAGGGGRASAIGGTFGAITVAPRFGAGQLIVLSASALIVLGAMVARTVAARLAAGAAVVVSVGVAALTWWYFRTNVVAPVVAGYGFYLSVVCIVGVIGCSIWAVAAALASGDGRSAHRVPVG